MGVLLCLTAVMLGAFGAHAFDSVLQANQRVDVFDLANRYHFYHGLAMMILAALSIYINYHKFFLLMVMLFTIGTLLFSGSLYALALTNLPWFGFITPVGGVLIIIAWGLALYKVISAH